MDDVRIEPIALGDVPADGNDITVENDALRLTISAQGFLREFRCKSSGKDYAAGGVPFPILRLVRRGVSTPVCRLTREGDLLEARFLDADLRASLRTKIEKQHVLFEVVDVQPGDVEQLRLEFPLNSQPVRRSYLFVVDATEGNTDKLIEYAKLGHFGTIILLKDNWLATHGHYQINTRNFPEGLASLKRTAEKIHAAGLGAGGHVFGPSISPNDPYVTPRPDDRLACVPCPPLAEAVDEKASTLLLTGPPPLPPNVPRNTAFPGHYLRIGDEIVRYQNVESGPPPRFVRCQRGALGTKAAPHAAGAEVKGLLAMWGFFLVDPDSTLADELTANFAAVFNECDFDMVYFDASDGIHDAYLDERIPGMLGMAANFTRADVGWYYMFNDVRPDQIEYVAAKTIGLDGSLSIETSQATMEKHPRARQMIEMVGRYEQARLANDFPEEVKAQLREPGKDFKLLGDPAGWKLYRATYEEPRYVETLDGKQNTWTIRNDQPKPCHLGVELACGFRNVPTTDYDHPAALTLERFDDTAPFQRSETNPTERFFAGPETTLTADGAVCQGVTARLAVSAESPRIGDRCTLFAATNAGPRGGWCATGRRFSQPVDLSRFPAITLWVDGDGKGESFRLQLRDTAGRTATWTTCEPCPSCIPRRRWSSRSSRSTGRE